MSELNKLAGTEVTFNIPDTETLGKLDGLQPQVSLNMGYRLKEEWEKLKGKPIKAYYLGLKQIPNPAGELVTCGLFVTSKDVFLAGGIILIDLIRDLPQKTPLQLTYVGIKTTKGEKEMLNFQVSRLG